MRPQALELDLFKALRRAPKSPIGDFALPVHLWVASCPILELSSHLLPQSHQKMTKELGVTVRDNGPWNPMQPHDLFAV